MDFTSGRLIVWYQWLVDGVRWLDVFARDELLDVTREIRPSCLNLNTGFKNQTKAHWLALYAFLSDGIEPFDSFCLSPSMYSLDFFIFFAFVYFSSVT